jgi:hypothetical protein
MIKETVLIKYLAYLHLNPVKCEHRRQTENRPPKKRVKSAIFQVYKCKKKLLILAAILHLKLSLVVCLFDGVLNISVISLRSVSLVEETGGQTLSHNVVHLALIEIQTHNISGDRH